MKNERHYSSDESLHNEEEPSLQDSADLKGWELFYSILHPCELSKTRRFEIDCNNLRLFQRPITCRRCSSWRARRPTGGWWVSFSDIWAINGPPIIFLACFRVNLDFLNQPSASVRFWKSKIYLLYRGIPETPERMAAIREGEVLARRWEERQRDPAGNLAKELEGYIFFSFLNFFFFS